MASREVRLAHNQESFRYANERLGELVTRADLDGYLVAFLCECADESCLGRVELSLAQYDDAHLLPNTYVILVGHPRIDEEEIIEEHDLFEVVQKAS
jgi:hypothetical protein